MKKILVLLFVFVVALSFAACGNSAVPSDDAVPGSSAGGDAAEDEEPDESAAGEYGELVTGTVVYYDGATLAICSLDDTNLNFLVAGDEVDKSETHGLAIGSETDVYYTGEINGNNTSAARVTKLVQSHKQSAVRTDLSVTGGIIVSADSSALSIASYGGEELTFSIASDEIDMEHAGGLTAGDYVTVFYEGEIGGGNGETVNVVKIVQ